MPAFLIADIQVNDADTYAGYRDANPAIVNKYGGRYIALGGEVKVPGRRLAPQADRGS